MTAQDHNKLIGIFFLIQGGLMIFAGVIVALIYGGMGAFMFTSAPEPEARTVGGIFVVAGIVVAIFIALFSIFFLVTGWKIYKGAHSGRVLGIIASILCLSSFPLGTALGVYGLWFFFGDQGKLFYEGGTSRQYSPPPPNSWQ